MVGRSALGKGYGELTDEDMAVTTTPGRAYYYKMQIQTAEHVIESIKAFGGIALAIEADLADPATIPMLFDHADEHLGLVDVLVNNAAYGRCDSFISEDGLAKRQSFVDVFPLATLTADSHDSHFAVNSRAVSLMMAEYAR